MNMVAFDTLKLARKLRDAGMPPEQAEAVAEAEAEALGEFVLANLATKADIAEVRGEIAEVRKDVAGLRMEVAEVREQVAGLRMEVAEVREQVAGLRSEMHEEIAGVRGEVNCLRAEMHEANSKLLQWVIIINLTSLGIVATIAGVF